jgi:tRNA nucleotidyltransferase/poly(A) polymerase
VRLIRGARYAARFGWQITASWQPALAAATAPEFWQYVAPGRIWRELQLLSDEAAAVGAFTLLSTWKIDHALFGVSLQADEFAALTAWRNHGQLEKTGTGKNWLLDLAILNMHKPDLLLHVETEWQTPDSELQRFRKLWRKLERGLPDPLVDKIAAFRLK